MIVSPESKVVRDKWAADKSRYERWGLFPEPPYWANALFRFGEFASAQTNAIARRVLGLLYEVFAPIVNTVTGIDIPRGTAIGPGLRIYHFGGVNIHSKTRIGSGCTMRHGVTIGERSQGGGVPIIGDDVEIGAYAQILGPIHVGDGARIGAMALVLDDVPAGATVVAPKAHKL